MAACTLQHSMYAKPHLPKRRIAHPLSAGALCAHGACVHTRAFGYCPCSDTACHLVVHICAPSLSPAATCVNAIRRGPHGYAQLAMFNAVGEAHAPRLTHTFTHDICSTMTCIRFSSLRAAAPHACSGPAQTFPDMHACPLSRGRPMCSRVERHTAWRGRRPGFRNN